MEIKDYKARFDFKSNGDDGRIVGYGAFYNNEDSSGDIIRKGSFAEIKRRIRMLYQHRDLIGSWDSVTEDEDGLVVTGKINIKTKLGSDVYELAKAKDLTDLSIGFVSEDFKYNDKGIREITKADLYEVSLVSFPANEKANIINVKAHDINSERDFEEVLRNFLGFSHKQAKHIANFGYKSLMKKQEKSADLDLNEILTDLKNFKI